MMNGCKVMIGAVLAATSATGVGAQDLVSNGSFENPVVPGGSSFIPNASIPGWSTSTVDVVGNANFPGNTGPQCVDLVGSPGLGTLSQSLTTVAGETYRLRFFLRSFGDVGADVPAAVRVSWAGQAIAVLDAIGAPLGGGGYVQHDVIVDATSSNTILTFEGLAYLGNWSGPLIDDVSVHRVGQWVDLGHALAGATGLPTLSATGTLLMGDPVALTLSNALPTTTTHLVVGFAALNAPFKGGVLVPDPDVVLSGLSTSPTGTIVIGATWPPGLPSGFTTYFQTWIADPAGPSGFSASNGLSGTTP